MLFDKNQTEFPSAVHRRIWTWGRLYVPPEISLADIHDARREAFLDLYNWTADLYTDMYEHPEAYLIDVEGIQAAMGRQTWEQARTSARYNRQKARMAKLMEMERANLPAMLRNHCFSRLRPDAPGVMEAGGLDKAVKYLTGKCKYSQAELWAVLGRRGLTYTQNGDVLRLVNEKYPLMFDAIAEWQRLLAPYKTWAARIKYDHAYSSLDYRMFLPGFQHGLDTIQWCLSDEIAPWLREIEKLLKELGLKPKYGYIGFSCDYKGEHLANFWHADTFRTVMFRPGSPEMAAFEAAVNALPGAEEIKAFCLKGLNRCRKCGCHPVHPSQLGRWCEVFGKRVNLCGGDYFTTQTFNEASLEIAKTLIRLSHKIIKEG